LHLDDDILFGKRWLGELINNIEKTGAWGGTCTRLDGEPPKEIGVTSVTGFGGPVRDEAWREQIRSKGMIPILNATGAWFLYDKSKLGPEPYDEDFFIYADDVYLGMRVWLNGGTLVRVYSKSKDADAKHLAMHVLQKRRKQYAAMIGTRNRLLNLLYFYQPSTLLKIAPLVAISQLAYTVMTPSQLPGRVWAYLWLLTHPRFIWRKRNVMQRERKVADSVLLGLQSCVMITETDVKNRVARLIVRACNAMFLAYGHVVRLPTRDVLNKRARA
jgi:GT2 family glycosyltransferase